MSFPRYPKYKDSGVEWLGQVPEHWEVKRLRFVAELNPSKSEVGRLDRDTLVSFLPMEAIGDDGSLSLEKEKTIGEVETGYTYFRDGDVTVAKITPCYENGKGALMRGLVNGIGFGTTELIVARPRPEHLSGTYLHYVFISPDFRSIGESHMYGAGGQKRVPDAFVRNFATAFPPIAEQTAIAAFLDRETGKIDELVAEQRRLMELLKEKRQAVISHAVTRGLNPAAPLKPSGIEWLGDIPAHWGVTKLARLATKIGDGLHGTPDYVDESQFRFINGNNLIDGSICVTDTTRCVSEVEFEKHRVDLDQTTLLLSINGTIGNLALYHGESVMLGKSAAYVNCNEELDREYLSLHLQSSPIRRYFDHSVTGTTISNLSLESVRRLPLALPPADEQRAIIAFLAAEIAKFDTLTTEAQRAIDLLQERRTALISAAVTGQIDVTSRGDAENAERKAFQTLNSAPSAPLRD